MSAETPKTNRPRIKGSVKITHLSVPRCEICQSPEAVYTIGYIDRENPQYDYTNTQQANLVYNSMLRSCPDHVAEVTAILLTQNNLMREDNVSIKKDESAR